MQGAGSNHHATPSPTFLPPSPPQNCERSPPLSRSQHREHSGKLERFAVQMGVLAGHSVTASCQPKRALFPVVCSFLAALRDLASQRGSGKRGKRGKDAGRKVPGCTGEESRGFYCPGFEKILGVIQVLSLASYSCAATSPAERWEKDNCSLP